MMAPNTAARGWRLTEANLAALNRSIQLDTRSRAAQWVNSLTTEVESRTMNDESMAAAQYRAGPPSSYQREIPEKAQDPPKRRVSPIAGSSDSHEDEPSPKRRIAEHTYRGYCLVNQGGPSAGNEAEQEEEKEDEDEEEEEEETPDPVKGLADDTIYPRTEKRRPQAFLECSLSLMGLPIPVATPRGRDFFRRAVNMDPLIPVDFDGTYSMRVDWENDPQWNQVYSQVFQPWFWTDRNRAATQRLREQRNAKERNAAERAAKEKAEG